MSNTRPELDSLEKTIAAILKQHPDTSVASQAGREMLAEQLASGLCKDAGVDVTIVRAFYYAMTRHKHHAVLNTDGMSVIVGIEWFDWLEGLLNVVIKEMDAQGFSVFVPSKGW